jgi:hypothetical protein
MQRSPTFLLTLDKAAADTHSQVLNFIKAGLNFLLYEGQDEEDDWPL